MVVEKDLLTPKNNKNIQKFLGTHSFNITPLTGDASSRNYFRITTPNKNYILMQSSDEDSNKNFVSVLNVLKNSGVNVPKLFEHEEVFILEDLGDISLEQFFFKEKREASISMYKKAIDQLIQIQNIKPNLNFNFDTKKLFEELIFFKANFFGETSKFDKELEISFQDISNRLDSKTISLVLYIEIFIQEI